MSNERIIKKLNKTTSKESVNVDAFIKINLESNDKLLPSDEINKIIDPSKVVVEDKKPRKKKEILQ